MKKFLTGIFLLFSLSAAAQSDTIVPPDTTWKKGGLIAVNFNQTSLTNWAAGGQNSLALSGIANFFLKYKKNKSQWDTNLDLAYGMVKLDDGDAQKNDDRIEFNSKYGYDAYKSIWFYTALVNAKTQFAPGYNYPNDSIKISDFAAPAYVLFSLGMDYKPVDYFSVFISPLTAKFTIVSDQDLADAGAFGVDPATYNELGQKTSDGENIRAEFGAYLNTRYQRDIMTNVNLTAKLDLFSNYSENPQNIDVNFDLLLGMKVNKFITASVGFTLIYDDDVMIQDGEDAPGVPNFGPRTQIRQTLGVGFSYKF